MGVVSIQNITEIMGGHDLHNVWNGKRRGSWGIPIFEILAKEKEREWLEIQKENQEKVEAQKLKWKKISRKMKSLIMSNASVFHYSVDWRVLFDLIIRRWLVIKGRAFWVQRQSRVGVDWGIKRKWGSGDSGMAMQVKRHIRPRQRVQNLQDWFSRGEIFELILKLMRIR